MNTNSLSREFRKLHEAQLGLAQLRLARRIAWALVIPLASIALICRDLGNGKPTAAMTLALGLLFLLVLSPLPSLVMRLRFGNVLDIAHHVSLSAEALQATPRDPSVVVARLESLRDESEQLEATSSRGDISWIRPDVWALSAGWHARRTHQMDELLRDLDGVTEQRATDDLTVGADILDTRDLAVKWVKDMSKEDAHGNVWTTGWDGELSICIDTSGLVTRGRAEGDLTEYTPDIPTLHLSGTGDSAGLSLFLAYIAEALGVRADERFAIAATGDLNGESFTRVGGLKEKLESAALCGACAVFLACDRDVFRAERRLIPQLICVTDVHAAATSWLEFRAELEVRAASAS